MLDFSIYTEIAKWIGWPAVSAVLILLIAVIVYLYNEYARILKEKNTQLQNEVESSKTYSFDQLLIRLQERHKVAMEEIDRLIKEKGVKDDELLVIKKELEDIKNENNTQNGNSKALFEKIEHLSKQVEIFKVESERAKEIARRKEVEIAGIVTQVSEMMQDYRKKIASLTK